MQSQKSGEYHVQGEALKTTCNPKGPNKVVLSSLDVQEKALPELSRSACLD